MHRKRGRPPGEIRIALLEAARAGPGTALELAHRAQVGRRNYAYTCARLVAAGELVVVKPGRPAVLAVAPPMPQERRGRVDEALQALERSFWSRPAGDEAPGGFDEL